MDVQEANNLNVFCGLVLIDKPAGMTSHKVVAMVRKALNLDKVGHLGTLDPFATGLLPVLLGGATRLSDDIMDGKKQYLFTISLGTETDTLDATGRVVAENEVPEHYLERIKFELKHFIGEIEQVPPVYSALKMNGKPLYEYMRASGKIPNPIETKKRKIFIDKLEIINASIEEKSVTLRVLCGKGTYVRALARDLAQAIGTVGYCSQLRREYVEPWSVEQALKISTEIDRDVLKSLIENNLIVVSDILPNIKVLNLEEIYLKQISSGNIVLIDELAFADKELLNKIKNCDHSIVNAFVKISNKNVMFYSEIKYLNETNQIKVMPRKKMY